MTETATERVVTLMTPTEKQRLEQRASDMGISAAELVRRSVASYDPNMEARDSDFEHLLDTLRASYEEAFEALTEAEMELAKTRRHFGRKEKT